MQKIIFILIFVSLCQCISQKKDIMSCEEMNKKSVDYILNFQINGDTTYLDSALTIINSALEKCSEQKIILSFRKLDVLAKKQDYPEAISFIKSLNKPIFIDLPYYNVYLLNRFKAMSYQLKGDTVGRNKCLRTNIQLLHQFLEKNKQKIYPMYEEDLNNILQNPLHFAPIQFYYCKSLLSGYETVKLELDSLQKVTNINLEYVELIDTFLNHSFMDFVGY